VSDRPRRPAVLLVSEENADLLLDEFGRYARDYDLHALTTAAAAEELAGRLRGEGRQVALFVSESVLPDAPVL